MKPPPPPPLIFTLEPVVAALAETGYAVWDDFLSPAEVLQLRAEARHAFREGDFQAAGVGRGEDHQLDRRIRGDFIRWVDRSTMPAGGQFFLDRLDEFIVYVNRTCFLGIREAEMHFAVYPAGTGYRRHLDVFRRVQSRKLSVICYLNEHWTSDDGGQLRMYLPGQEGKEETLDILPLGGRLVCFLSDRFEHEVLPARRERYSLTGWLTNEERIL